MVVGVSAITSAVVSVLTVVAIHEGRLLASDAEVPDVVALSVEAGRGALESRGLRLVHRGERHDDEIAAGMIAEQQPRAGSIVPAGSEVTVILSQGPDRVEVPDVTGLSLVPARARLANAGLRASSSVRAGSGGEPGTVTATVPRAGERVARGTEVELVAVLERVAIAVPDLTGMSSRAAREAIAAAGLTVGRVRTTFDGDRSPFIVLRQTPAPGVEVDPGTEIEIVVNEE